MNLPFFIAKRYLVSKKSHQAIHIISAVSVCGVALATMAMVCTLSVFNGFSDVVSTFFTAFDAELKITAVKGKVFDVNEPKIQSLKEWKEISVFSETLEDNAMVRYNDRQAMVVIKGVDEQFRKVTAIDSILWGHGKPVLQDEVTNYAIPGIALVSQLGSGVKFLDPYRIYAPKRGAKINVANPSAGFVVKSLHSTGLAFAVNQQKYDEAYILSSLSFARELFQYTTEVSAIELKLSANADIADVQQKIQSHLGSDFRVQDRYQQQADTFNIMEVEKLISYIFLTCILVIACFNVIGSLSMLILDKRDDVLTLRKLGANDQLITRIFVYEGCLISFVGSFFGVVLGVSLCLLQQEYGWLSMGGAEVSSNFIIQAYPVSVQLTDVLLCLLTVLVVGFLAVWYPVRYLSKRLLF